jgi:ATP-dependent exoDNAse (exonuclease V) beta subunit
MGNREDRPRGPLYLSLREFARQGRGDDRDRKAVGEFVAHMDSLRAIADTLTVGEILERIIARTQYDARVLVRPGGRRRLANVRKLLWMAHAASDRRVSEFVRNLREIERLAEREGDAPTEEEAADVVRFVTVHKAKGLEFPVVYIADLNRSLKHSSEGLFECDPSAPAIACRIGDYKSVAYRAISESRNDRDLREAHRVLYVAMTRARERLVLSGSATARRAGSSWADTVFGQLGIVAPPQAPQLLSWADGVRVAPLPVAPPVP